jgi:hypothetical protein
VSGRRIERITGLVDLFPISKDEPHATGDDVSPMRALASLSGQRLQRAVEVGVGLEGDELDGVAVHLLAAVGHRSHLADVRGRSLRELRHGLLLPRGGTRVTRGEYLA